MLTVFGALKGAVRTNAPGEVHLASPWSAVHHRLTAVLLLFLMLLVSAKQYLGEPVQCLQQKDDPAVPEKVMNTYCFIATTYTVVRPRPQHPAATAAGRRQAWGLTGSVRGALHPGLQGLVQGLGPDPDHGVPEVPDVQGASIRRHAYYQWVPLVLALQAMLFYAPYYVWTMWEGGLINGLIKGLRLQELLGKRDKESRMLARYFEATLNSHVPWAVGYWAAELANLVNVAANALLLDAVLGGRFFTYGYNVLSWSGNSAAAAASGPAPVHPQLLDPYPDFVAEPARGPRPADPNDHPEDPNDPMEAVFPKLTKCTFFKYGASGSIQRHDALCVMALNVVNEKVFVLLWVWYAALAAVSVLVVVRSGLALTAYALASRSRTRPALWLMGRLLGLPPLQPELMQALAGRLDAGDWLLLVLLAANMPRVVFRGVARDIALFVGDPAKALYALDTRDDTVPAPRVRATVRFAGDPARATLPLNTLDSGDDASTPQEKEEEVLVLATAPPVLVYA